ncbi:MAG: hypothetical protein QOD42_254 [Sphingomonadales bacterium]|jgi:mannose-6-phosphate isomerase-like protein (cupin superfamily)|nr:hypothetical protein [Sphingomonadales bacterium]
MKGGISCANDVTAFRDDRYATLWELAGPPSGLRTMSAALAIVDPGKTSPPHWHEATEEIYMIVSGSGLMYLGDAVRHVSSGDCVSIPVGLVHAIGNPGPEPLTMWVATSPPYDEQDDFEIDG